MLLRHKGCGEAIEAEVRCSHCGERLHADDTRLEPGPGARDVWGTRDVFLLQPKAKRRGKAKERTKAPTS